MMIELHRAGLERPGPGRLLPADLAVPPGEKIVLTGPEGCGKRALLSLMTGAAAPGEGTVRFTDGGAELSPGERKRRCRLIPPGGGLWENLTVWENLVTVCRLYGMSRHAAEYSGERAMDACGLGRAEDIRFGRLPPDWRARAALGAALACGAETIGAVSLTEGLKEHESRRIAELAGRVFDGKTTVIVCDDRPVLAEVFGKRILLLGEGRIVFDGTAEELRRARHRGNTAPAARALRGRDGE